MVIMIEQMILLGLMLFFMSFIMFLMFKNRKRKRDNQIETEKNDSYRQVLTQESKYKNLSESKSTVGGIIASQESKEKKVGEELVKPIGWVVAKSYEEDIKNANLEKYMPDSELAKKEVDKETKKTKNTKISILLVDDSITVLKFMNNLLNKFNYELILKEDGTEAVEYLSTTDQYPDVIITDLEMPKMDGYTLIKHIRGIQKFNYIPILVVSSTPETHIYLMEEGLVNGMIKKPFDKEDFIQQVKYLINNPNQA